MKLRTALLFVLAAYGVGCTESPRSDDRPLHTPRRDNVVVITIDTLRADSLGVYGNPGGHSPHLDAWAADAVVFDNAITAIGTTFPSHATLFTGLYPKHHGVRKNADRLDDRFTTLAEVLGDAGYETASFVSLRSMVGRGGLHQGVATGDGIESRGPVRPGTEINERALPWLSARGERPFFLWLHYFEPHSPYPLTDFARQQLADYAGPLADGASVETFYSLGSEIPWTAEETRAVRALYDGRVRDADRAVGEILQRLGQLGLLSETLVVVTSDHGQALGEHGAIGHGWKLIQPVLHVPLIAHLPGVEPRRIRRRVGLVDLMPTILDWLGLPIAAELDGTSLRPLLTDQPMPQATYFAEVRDSKDPQPRDRSLAVFDADLKAVFRPGEWNLYDLAGDPQELRPMAPDLRDDRQAALRRLAASYRDSAIEASRPDLSDQARRELEALGYIE